MSNKWRRGKGKQQGPPPNAMSPTQGSAQNPQVLNAQSPFPPEVTFTAQQTIYNGPVVHPDIAEQWESVCPGAADRILTQFEQQAAHRQQLETNIIAKGQRNELVGSIFAFIIFLTAIIGGIWLISIGKDITGLIALIGGLAVPIALFIAGRQGAIAELQKKRKALEQAAGKNPEEH